MLVRILTMNDTSILVIGIIVTLTFLLLERFIVRRGLVTLINCELSGEPRKGDESIAVILDYSTNSQSLPFSKLSGRLVDKAAPTTVIELKSRSLAAISQSKRSGDTRHSNYCQEFLHFNIKPFLLSGDEVWELHLDTVTIGSHFNPFYKIFPIISRLRGEILIKQPKR